MSRKQERQISKVLLLHDNREAERDKVMQSCQCEAFVKEYRALASGYPILPKSPFIKLNPVLNEHGCVLSNGRLQFVEYLLYGVQFPKMLPQRHWVTKLIVKYWYHYEQANHSAGTNFCAVPNK